MPTGEPQDGSPTEDGVSAPDECPSPSGRGLADPEAGGDRGLVIVVSGVAVGSPATGPEMQQMGRMGAMREGIVGAGGVVTREWDGECHECCGDGHKLGLLTCMASCLLPWMAIGLNIRRAFGASALLWMAFFLVLYLPQYYNVYVYSFVDFEEDSTGQMVSALIYFVGGLTTGVLIVAIGAYNRMRMRRRFMLPGNSETDIFLWLCCSPCALCQETRTLVRNGVSDGVWRGPEGLAIGIPAADIRQPIGFPIVQHGVPFIQQGVPVQQMSQTRNEVQTNTS